MPPKPLAEDLARKKAERDKAKQAQEMLAILESPSGFEQTVNAIKDPVGTAKQLGRVAKETFYDPSKRFARAVDPSSGASPVERAAGLAESALYAADVLTPVPEQALYREAMERVLDDEVARYAASGGGAKYRGVLGVHGSPEMGLTELLPRSGSVNNPNEAVTWFWDALPGGYNAADLMNRARGYAKGEDNAGELYIARFPPSGVKEPTIARPNSYLTVANQSLQPGRVVGSVKITPEMYERFAQTHMPVDFLKEDAYPVIVEELGRKMRAAMTPAERRAMDAAAQTPGQRTVKDLVDDAIRLRNSVEALRPSRGDF